MNRKNVIREKLEVIVKPLTPTHVWSGRTAIVGIDAVLLNNNEICLIDFERLPYEVVEKHMNQDIDLETLAKEGAKAGACTRRLRVTENAAEELRRKLEGPKRVKPELKLLSNEVIPPTTLKGYMRTAIMLQALLKMDKQKLKKALEAGTNFYAKHPKYFSLGLEGLIFRRSRGTKAGGYIDIMQKVLVSGPSMAGVDAVVHIFYVYKNLRTKIRPLAEALVEVVRAGELRYKVDYLSNIEDINQVADKWLVRELLAKYDEVYRADVLEGLAWLGCEVLEDELNRIKDVRELSPYADKLREWQRRYCGGRKECVIGRVGFMTGHQAKTVMLLVRKEHPDLYRRIIGYMSRQVRRTWDSLTLKLTPVGDGLVGTGWCEICVKRA